MNSTSTIKTAILMMMLCFAEILSAQAFQKVGGGINLPQNSYAYGTCSWSDNSGVYFGYREITYNPYAQKGKVAKWDGVQWVNYPALPGGNVTCVASYNGDVYAGTSYGVQSNLYRFDGNSWQPVFSNISGDIVDLEVYNGNLVCVGAFSEGTTGNYSIIGYDGSQPVAYPTLEQVDSVADVSVIGNELWVAGHLYGFDRGDTANVKKLSGGTWTAPAIAHKTPASWYRATGIFEYNSKIYMLEYNALWEIKNDTAYYVGNAQGNDYAIQGGKVYLTSWQMQLFDGNTIATIANAPSDVATITSHGNHLYGFFNDTIFNGDRSYNHVFRSNTQYGLLSGRTYIDNNSNCTYEAGQDQKAGRMKLVAQGNPSAYIHSDRVDGTYQVALAPGNYTFSNVTHFSPINRYLTPACNNATSISIQANQSYTENFVVQHDGTVDLETSFHPYIRHRAREGFTEGYTIRVRNPGVAISSPFDVKITLPSTISLSSMNPQASSVNGNTYTFSFSGIGERKSESIQLQLKIDVATNAVNDTLWFYSDIVGISNDAAPANDKDTLWQRVVAACDPNDKTASVEESLPGLDRLDYHIRFQNTGTDTAYKVVIVDTLESYFDPASIIVNASSHDYSFNMESDNILVWTFENILLPDSGASQLGSRGFVDFSIDVDPNLTVGDTIDNDAEIYFDYQEPVHTNHAKTAIVQNISLAEHSEGEVMIDVYPNPASEEIHIQNRATFSQNFRLFDRTGKLMDEIAVKAGAEAVYPISNLARGLYLLRSENQTFRVLIR